MTKVLVKRGRRVCR